MKNIFDFHFFKIYVNFKLPTMRWKTHIVNNICDRGGKQTKKNAFSKIMKILLRFYR